MYLHGHLPSLLTPPLTFSCNFTIYHFFYLHHLPIFVPTPFTYSFTNTIYNFLYQHHYLFLYLQHLPFLVPTPFTLFCAYTILLFLVPFFSTSFTSYGSLTVYLFCYFHHLPLLVSALFTSPSTYKQPLALIVPSPFVCSFNFTMSAQLVSPLKSNQGT